MPVGVAGHEHLRRNIFLACGGVAVVVGLLVLVGWAAGISVPKSVVFGLAVFTVSNIAIFSALVYWTASQARHSEVRRMLADKSLRESEQRYRVLTDALPHMVWTMRPDQTLEYLNHPASAFTGLSVQEVNAGGWGRLIHPDDVPGMTAEVSGPLERGEPHEVEYRFLHHTGTYRWVVSRAVPVKNDAGVVVQWVGSTHDIHDRKVAEEALKEGERRFRILLEGLPQLVWTCLPDGWCDYLSRQWVEYTGVPEADQLGYGWSEAVHPEDRPALLERWQQAVGTGQPFDVEFRIRSGAGAYRWFKTRAVRFRMPDGTEKWFGTNTDIHDKKVLEAELKEHAATLEQRVGERTKALRHEEERFRSAFEFAPIGMALVAPDGKWLRVNRSLCELVGYTDRELLATDFQTITHPDDLATDLGHVGRMLDGTIQTYQMEKRYFHKRGHVVHVLLSVSLVRDGAGQPLYFISQIIDISHRKDAERALAANEALLQQFIKHSPAAIAMFDRDVRYLQLSDRWLTDYKLSGRDIIGLCHYEVFPDIPDRWKVIHRRVLAGAVEKCDEDPFHRADGSTQWLQWECRPWLKVGGEVGGLIMFTQVITQRKLAEEQIKASLREKEVLLKEIHHRVKNNLQIVSTLLDLQSDHTTDSGALAMFRESRGRVKSMALIHERLYRSQDMARVNFTEYVRQLADDLYRTYKVSDDDIRLELDVDIPPLPIDIAIPCGLLLNELMSNCFKHAFADATGGCLRVALYRAGDGTNVLVVSDTGTGFPADTDFRNTTSFGLQLVNTLVDQLHGEIELTTDRGTTFTVRFPRTKS